MYISVVNVNVDLVQRDEFNLHAVTVLLMSLAVKISDFINTLEQKAHFSEVFENVVHIKHFHLYHMFSI